MEGERDFESAETARRYLLSLRRSDHAVLERDRMAGRYLELFPELDRNERMFLVGDYVALLFEVYERMVFKGALSTLIEAGNHTVAFSANPRLSRAGGRVLASGPRMGPRRFDVQVSSYLLARSFTDLRPGPIKINGIYARDRLTAMMLVLEHELVHLAEYLMYGMSSCSGQRFRRLAYDWFGHTEVTHSLATARVELREMGLGIGSRVCFEYDGQTLRGVINRVTKRATVLVRCQPGEGALFNDGHHYCKYYVGLSSLRADTGLEE